MEEVEKVKKAKESTEVDPFESFFEQNYGKIYGLLYRLTGEKMEAEDLTIEAFVRYFTDPPADLKQSPGWIYRVATRLGLNALRSNKRRTHYESRAGLYIAGSPADPSQELERERQRSRVREVLRKMEQRDAQILILYHSGCSYKEIAAAIEVAATSIGTLVARAQKRFEQLYGGPEYT